MKACNFYQAAKRDFEEDIRGLKDYARPLLGEIWERKVKSLDSRRDHPLSENLEEALPPMTFQSTYQCLEDSLEIAMHARPPKDVRKYEEIETTWKQVVLKVDRERQDILAFAAIATKKFGQLGPLITELNLLITYLSNNKPIWDRDRSSEREGISPQEDFVSGYPDGPEPGMPLSTQSFDNR